jgi:hypothetical protein
LNIKVLKAFLAIHMYMGMKKQPNIETYWEREGSIFHCPIESNIMTREQFKDLWRCFHITDRTTYEHIQKDNRDYDKLQQVQWFVNEIHDAYMREL